MLKKSEILIVLALIGVTLFFLWILANQSIQGGFENVGPENVQIGLEHPS